MTLIFVLGLAAIPLALIFALLLRSNLRAHERIDTVERLEVPILRKAIDDQRRTFNALMQHLGVTIDYRPQRVTVVKKGGPERGDE